MTIDLLRAEVLKLRTTRTTWILALAAWVLVAGAVGASAAATTFTPTDLPARQVLALAGPIQTVALLLGVLAVTTEFRHGTITPVLLITPRRTPLLTAKFVVLAAAGAVLGLVAYSLAAATSLPILAARGIPGQLHGVGLAGIIGGGAAATVLFAALGVGFGALIRNQVGGVVTALALLYVAEPLVGAIPGVGPAVPRFGLAGLSSAASATTAFGSTHLLTAPAAIALLTAYAAVVLTAGGWLFRGHDIAP